MSDVVHVPSSSLTARSSNVISKYLPTSAPQAHGRFQLSLNAQKHIYIMAANIPTQLKSADLGRFALRAAQIEKAKPVIAYWCKYRNRLASRNRPVPWAWGD